MNAVWKFNFTIKRMLLSIACLSVALAAWNLPREAKPVVYPPLWQDYAITVLRLGMPGAAVGVFFKSVWIGILLFAVSVLFGDAIVMLFRSLF